MGLDVTRVSGGIGDDTYLCVLLQGAADSAGE